MIETLVFAGLAIVCGFGFTMVGYIVGFKDGYEADRNEGLADYLK